MLIQDPKNLVLQNDMGSSATGDVFSIDPPATDEPDPIVIPCTGLKASETSYKVPVNSSPFYLGVKILPSDCTEQIYFTSSNDSIVKVDNIGNVTPGSKVGKTIINVTCGSQSMTINFETVDITASSIDLSPAVLTLSMKEGATVKAKVLPSTASQKVKWTSSDPSIATVDVNGYVIGQFLGKAKITATAENGVSSHIHVYVDGETVIFELQDHVSVKASSGQKIPYKAYLIINSGEYYNKQDVTLECEFHTAFTSALDIDGNGNVYAKGAVYDTVDIPVYFTWNDGSSLNVTSQTFIVHVEK
ncbi:MAG: Ig-like domain-containing protein, partial [Erysipelotrichaceae bacterium]|nr:Ig-like domain-containing protein [Erysipelotrichaceae bacterium]